MTTMTLRPATTKDAEAISALLAASYGKLYRGWYPDRTLAALLPGMSRAKPQLLRTGTYFVVEEDEAPIGCGGWTAYAPLDGKIREGVGHVRHFATHPDHVRKGVARTILTAAAEQARKVGIERFDCLSSLPAERFYESLGFRALRRGELPMAGGVPFGVVEMTVDLPLSRPATAPR